MQYACKNREFWKDEGVLYWTLLTEIWQLLPPKPKKKQYIVYIGLWLDNGKYSLNVGTLNRDYYVLCPITASISHSSPKLPLSATTIKFMFQFNSIQFNSILCPSHQKNKMEILHNILIYKRHMVA
jgi:hypothetical protein